MKQLVASILLTFLFCRCDGQDSKMSYIRQRKVNAFNQIFDLRQGCLLVMLHMGTKKYETLKKLERNNEAEKYLGQQKDKNKNIIKAFRRKFNFCPVYFFSGSEAIKFLESGPDAVVFLDDQLNPDTSIHINKKKYFVAEFNKLQDDTTGYASRHHPPPGDKRVETYQTSSSSTTNALIVESDRLIQLKSPFPYFVLVDETEERIIYIETIVNRFNNNLHRFEKKAKKKILGPRFSRYFEDKLIIREN